MAARHGTRRGYKNGCRCDDCKYAQRLYQQRYRQRRAAGVVADPTAPFTQSRLTPSEIGPVESGVEAEIAGPAESRPGLAAAALALARILDNPKAVSSQPAAAKVLAGLLRTASAHGRRGHLALVRTMTEKG
jgi:hypothetical protein